MKLSKNWEIDKKWSDLYLNQIKSIIGQVFIKAASLEEDQDRNTDLIVFKMESIRIGCRVRRYEYFLKYKNDFTIRSGRPSGNKTELSKIIEGWGNYLFYGFADDEKIISWKIGDLNVFRMSFNLFMAKNNGKIIGQKMNNKDNSSSFITCKWNDFPKEFIIAESNDNINQ